MNGEFTYHVALQLAVLLGCIILDFVLHDLVMHALVSLTILLLPILGLEVTEDHLLVRHWSCVGRDELFEFVLSFTFARVGIRAAATAALIPLVVFVTFIQRTA